MILRAAALLLIASCLLQAGEISSGQVPQSEGEDHPTSTTQQLFAQEHWPQVVQSVESTSERSPDLNYYYGVALAHLARWDDARQALLAGSREQCDDKRFPIELAGVAFGGAQRLGQQQTRSPASAISRAPVSGSSSRVLQPWRQRYQHYFSAALGRAEAPPVIGALRPICSRPRVALPPGRGFAR